ncbi:hypothetical protein [Sphaerisporangium sp. NPDC051011]|uniref:hypothetical protein n=1 Tax=Sphaerisporangium sp. NPDC051011 TaxID=3155792 RepID=UPI0033D16BA3
MTSQLKVGVWDYDHARSLFDGTVKIDGFDATFESAGIVSEIFERMVRDQAYDVAELGLTFYLRTLDLEESPFIALPIFPNRHFRHSAIWVNTDSGITSPRDLVGKTIGEFATYGHDAGIWPKGILSDDYGFTPDQARWVVGGTNRPMKPFDFIPFLHPSDVDVQLAPEGRTLGSMLEAGEIDALISALVPQEVLQGSTKIAPLFPDYELVERDYYRRTGIYPIMHTIVVRREYLAQHPELPRAVYDGFSTSRDIAVGRLEHGRMEQHIESLVPWSSPLYERNRTLLASDHWAYGVEANRVAVDTFLRYTFEQGLSKRRLTPEDIFVPDLLDT